MQFIFFSRFFIFIFIILIFFWNVCVVYAIFLSGFPFSDLAEAMVMGPPERGGGRSPNGRKGKAE